MKSFYEMIRILEGEEVKTPGGYVLSPEVYEMASFSLPRKMELFGKEYSAIDMKFEIPPKTFDRNGVVMNQGSKFFARVPHTDKYIVYDGAGYTQFSSPNKEDILLKLGYERVPDDWYKKADFID